MRYQRSASFLRSLDDMPPDRVERVRVALQRFINAMDMGQTPHGLGLKPLRNGYWEFRAGLSDRIVFHRDGDLISFVLVGTHDGIKRFLRRQ